MDPVIVSRNLECFADILDYPTSAIDVRLRECDGGMNDLCRDYLARFLSFVEVFGLRAVEEAYTKTFELHPLCIPYSGYHLFGEDPVRGIFMVRLKELYGGYGLRDTTELPDHISVMLRFLVVAGDREEARDMVTYCVIPTVREMIRPLQDGSNPYGNILKALLGFLENIEGQWR